MRKIAGIGACILAGAFVSLAGMSARTGVAAAQAPPVDQARIAAGKRLVADTCQNDHCHGGSARAIEDMSGLTAERARKVVIEGVSEAGMQPFRGVYTPQQLDDLVAYVVWASADHGTGVAAAPVEPSRSAGLRGDAAAGRALVFEAKLAQTCLDCHAFEGQGGHVGPDLTQAARKPTRDLFRAIVLREAHASARMPTDEYASRYSLKQLLDIVAFLKSIDPAAAGDVTLTDVF